MRATIVGFYWLSNTGLVIYRFRRKIRRGSLSFVSPGASTGNFQLFLHYVLLFVWLECGFVCTLKLRYVYSKNLGTLWEDLGKEMEGEDEIEIGEVDCSTDKSVCDKVHIHSYPTFKLFYNGEEILNYQGDDLLLISIFFVVFCLVVCLLVICDSLRLTTNVTCFLRAFSF